MRNEDLSEFRSPHGDKERQLVVAPVRFEEPDKA